MFLSNFFKNKYLNLNYSIFNNNFFNSFNYYIFFKNIIRYGQGKKPHKLINKKLFNQHSLVQNFKYFKKKYSGRNYYSGRITCYTKKKTIKYKSFNLLNNFLYCNLSLLSNIFFDTFSNNLLNLWKLSNGCFFLKKHIYNTFIGNITKTISHNSTIFKNFVYFSHPLYLLNSGDFISNIEWKNRICFSKSFKSYSKILSLNFSNNSVDILLPSKKTKNFPISTLCIKVENSNKFNIKNFYNKAGYHYNLGRKPIVRGIAMNSCDHPNGGNTNTKQKWKTPWGKIINK